MSFAVLLCLQLLLKLLLEFLFGEVHFTNGSVVFYPPLTSGKKGVQFSICLCDISVLPTSNAGLAGYTEKRFIMAARDHVANWTGCDGYHIQKPQKYNLSGKKMCLSYSNLIS